MLTKKILCQVILKVKVKSSLRKFHILMSYTISISYDVRVIQQLTRRVSLVDQELLALPKHLISPSGFSGVRVAQSSVFCRSLFETVKCMFQNRFIGVFSSNLIISWGQFYWCRE